MIIPKTCLFRIRLCQLIKHGDAFFRIGNKDSVVVDFVVVVVTRVHFSMGQSPDIFFTIARAPQGVVGASLKRRFSCRFHYSIIHDCAHFSLTTVGSTPLSKSSVSLSKLWLSPIYLRLECSIVTSYFCFLLPVILLWSAESDVGSHLSSAVIRK